MTQQPSPHDAQVSSGASSSIAKSAGASEGGLEWLRVSRGWRWIAYVALAAVLGLGFWAYQSPAMRLSWDTVAALCGI